MHVSQTAAVSEKSSADFWPRALVALHAELGEHRYRMWIAPIRLKAADPDRVVLHCTTPFHQTNVQEKFGERIRALIAQFSRIDRPVEFVTDRPALEPRDPQALFDSLTLPAAAAKRITVDMVKRHVAERFGVSQSDLESKSRKREVVRPRQVVMYMARQLTDQSFPQIARRLGPRDHSTILHGDRLIAKMVAEDSAFAAEMEALKRSIRDSNPG